MIAVLDRTVLEGERELLQLDSPRPAGFKVPLRAQNAC